ncbi:hypothetical protein [Pseudorhodoplanes sp.]|uniref:hypothetical protein n=1 Tax=Pseudorhodoplanes sp. TaxID=1934341 RepID=UPI002D05777B|nr:hypothetical protein [Pseudorhodoplanes sp.]HWV42229.1 hypothetical protein [Pseudorhodoplanes sp.]
MRRVKAGRYGRHISAFISLAAVMLTVAGCSSSGGGDGTSFGERFTRAMATGTTTAPAPASTTGASTALDTCPNADIRRGAGTITINTNARDPSAMQLRYQVSVVQLARECANVAGTLTIKVGLHGRVVLGPAGTPGTIEVPVRYALVEEGPEPKTVYSKLYRVPVTIGEGQPSVSFTHIEEEMAVPMPPPAVFDRYVIYVGYDPLGSAQERRQTKKRPAKKN